MSAHFRYARSQTSREHSIEIANTMVRTHRQTPRCHDFIDPLCSVGSYAYGCGLSEAVPAVA